MAIRDDRPDMQLRRGLNRLLSQERGHIQIIALNRHTDIVSRQFCLLRLTGYLCHCLNSLNRILSISGLTTQHQGIRSIINRVRNIGHLRTSRTRIIDHRMQHLGCHDHRLLHLHALADQDTLNTRNTLCRDLDTQITTGNHDTVSGFQDLVDIIHAFLVLDLGDDLDRAVIFIQDTLDIQHVLLVSHE